MNIVVTIKHIITKGRLVGRGAFLICRGTKLDHNKFKMKSKFQFYDSLITNTSLDPFHISSIVLSPLSTQMTVVAKVDAHSEQWPISMAIDLNKWRFSIAPQCESLLSQEIAYLLFASFGIQKGQRALSFATLTAKNKAFLSYRNHLRRSVDDDLNKER